MRAATCIAALILAALIGTGCDQGGGSTDSASPAPVTHEEPAPESGTTSSPESPSQAGSQAALAQLLDSAAGSYSSPDSGAQGFDAYVARAQALSLAADSIAAQLQAAQPGNADWSALDGGYIQDFAYVVCSGQPEDAAHTLMREAVPNADLRAAPALTQAVMFVSSNCPADLATLNRASDVMNQYVIENQRLSDLVTAQQVQQAAPTPPGAVGNVYRGICSVASFTIRKVLKLGGLGSLLVKAASVTECPRWIAGIVG